MLTHLEAVHGLSGTVTDLGTWPDAETTDAAMADHAVDLQEDHGPVIRTWPGIGEGVTNVTYKDGHAIYFRETKVAAEKSADNSLALALHSGGVYHLMANDGTTVTVAGANLAEAIRAVPIYKITEPEYLDPILDSIRDDVANAVEELARPLIFRDEDSIRAAADFRADM